MRTLAVLLAASLMAGCGSDAAPERASSSAGVLAIRDFRFMPDPITVAAGTRVRWTNRDDAPHTATADDGSFDTGNLGAGETGGVTLRKPGVFAYSCEFHRFMRAKITVR
jgi:plastocyanin